MKKFAYLLLLAVPAMGLAQDQKQASTATICFYRSHRFEGAALKPPIYVDEIDVAHLHNGDAVQVTLSPGAHKVYSNDKSTGVELDAKAGETYFVRVDIKTGAWKGHGQITLIDPQEGKYEFSKEKLSVTRNLTENPAVPAPDPGKASNPVTKPTSSAPSSTQSSAAAPASPGAASMQGSSSQNSTTQAQSEDQQPSLGEVARQYREKKAKAQPQDQPAPPQN